MDVLTTIIFIVALSTTSIAQNLDSIKAELERDYKISLSLRKNVVPTVKRYGYKSKQMDSLNQAIIEFDSLALSRTVNIIEKYGWLGKSEIGFTGNQALFLNIQHAHDNKIREKYYQLFEESVGKGQSNKLDLATMKDRILVENGQPQLYGTQKDIEGKYYPISDIEGINKRRKKVGLEKIKISKQDLRQVQ